MTMTDDYRARARLARGEAGEAGEETYRARARLARGEAGEAGEETLENVRDKLLRSASAWDLMANREEPVAAARQAREVEKRNEIIAELSRSRA